MESRPRALLKLMMNHIGFGGPMFLNWGSGLGLLLLRLAPATIMTNYQYQLFGKFLELLGSSFDQENIRNMDTK